jgi:hypothetical protein
MLACLGALAAEAVEIFRLLSSRCSTSLTAFKGWLGSRTRATLRRPKAGSGTAVSQKLIAGRAASCRSPASTPISGCELPAFSVAIPCRSISICNSRRSEGNGGYSALRSTRPNPPVRLPLRPRASRPTTRRQRPPRSRASKHRARFGLGIEIGRARRLQPPSTQSPNSSLQPMSAKFARLRAVL